MQTIIRVKDPGSFAATVPLILGYKPENSVTVIPLKNNRSVGCFRTDIPPADQTIALAAIVAQAISVCQAEAIGIVTYGTREQAQHCTDTLTTAATILELPVAVTAYVTGNQWGTLDSDEEHLTPLAALEYAHP